MQEIKEYSHFGVYGILLRENKILLIKKKGGPYDGKLDLPGGTFEFGEKPEAALKREIKEEVGIDVLKFELFDANSVLFDSVLKGNQVKVHHIGIFYKLLNYSNDIRCEIEIDSINDDSLGADWYDIANLSKGELSNIAVLELEKMGYKLTDNK